MWDNVIRAMVYIIRLCEMIYLILFVGWVVWVIGVWLGTYIGGIVILVIEYIGLVLGFVIRGILFCLLGGYACGLGRYPHFVLG